MVEIRYHFILSQLLEKLKFHMGGQWNQLDDVTLRLRDARNAPEIVPVSRKSASHHRY